MSFSKYALFAFSFTLLAGSPSAFAQEFRSNAERPHHRRQRRRCPGAKISVVNNDTKMAYTASRHRPGRTRFPTCCRGPTASPRRPSRSRPQ